LSHEAQESLVPMIARTGRLCLRMSPTDQTLWNVSWDEGEPFELVLEVRPEADKKKYTLTGVLRRGPERRPLSEPVLLVAGGLVFWKDRVSRLRDFDAFEWVALLRQNGSPSIPAKQIDALLAELARVPKVPPLELPDELRYEEVTIPPRPRLKVKAPDRRVYYQWDRLTGELAFDYGGTVVPAGEASRGVWQKDERKLLVRDAAAEQAAAQRLQELGFRTQYYRAGQLDLAPRNLPRVVRTLLDSGWYVEAEGKLYRQPGAFKLSVASGVDWFELHGDITFGDTSVSLPALLAAARQGETVVRLDDGTFGMLPEGWLKKYGLLARLGKAEGDHVRFSRGQAGLLDALLAEQPDATWDEAFARTRDELLRFQGVQAAEAPAGFVGELRGYQREGLGWLRFLQAFGFGGCLADDMGLGKTVQVLALLAGRAAEKPGRPTLVVVPKSLVFNWAEEAARFTPDLRVLQHVGIERRKAANRFDDYDIVLTTYGTLRRDILTLKDYTFDYCILDEAQAIKNAASESAKAARLLKAEHRLALSGTPVENHLGELWSLFEFLNPGLLGSASVFRVGAGARDADVHARVLLARALRPFILRRTKQQVARDLPEKLEQTLYVDMEPAQRKLYDELRDHYRQSLLARVERDGIKRSKIQVLEALLRLRQAACHPGLLDKKHVDGPSAKFDMLLPQLTEVLEEGHKILVFSQFTSLLTLLKRRLDADGIAYEYLDGKTRNRAAKVEHFQNDPDCKLFLISLKAGGLGLNLTAAEYVYLLDPWWNPAVEAQAIDRTHRIGQTRRVFAYRLITRGTVEEKVLELQRTKRELADAVITADNALIRDLGREDLELLLS
jgi:superfamily II DNA or RNA helicase